MQQHGACTLTVGDFITGHNQHIVLLSDRLRLRTIQIDASSFLATTGKGPWQTVRPGTSVARLVQVLQALFEVAQAQRGVALVLATL